MPEFNEVQPSMADTLPNSEAPERDAVEKTLDSIVTGAEELKGKELSDAEKATLEEINKKLSSIMPGQELIH